MVIVIVFTWNLIVLKINKTQQIHISSLGLMESISTVLMYKQAILNGTKRLSKELVKWLQSLISKVIFLN